MTLRIVLSGVESVGKSTLAADLAAHFNAALVPEYGRTYCEGLDRPLTPADLTAIAEGHARGAHRAMQQAPACLIEDTDILMTAAWARMLFGAPQPDLAAWPSHAHLHLLLLPDVPFVSDPVRVFGDPGQRLAFHRHVVAEFIERRTSLVPVGGGWDARRARAIAAIESCL
ncbi:AAA family ATPase [Sandaracinobacteroides saxicola]|uniref:ATP-binding protein n=1 Tax=Sandaracinobacteroides saxicola TaxID=2759707 RepID=A0A7G5IEN2_9SPHN|nr:ATP-binding protein [Sandaracinobacteroides saxicola]QMW21824.1 ATP-binding protein [Sandaracinobacteroides saxicola]